MFQRFLALFLALLLFFPVAGYAAEVEETEESIEPAVETTSPTEVTEEEENTDDTDTLQDILVQASASAEYLRLLTGCVVFFVVVVLCFFVYKFFRIFF